MIALSCPSPLCIVIFVRRFCHFSKDTRLESSLSNKDRWICSQSQSSGWCHLSTYAGATPPPVIVRVRSLSRVWIFATPWSAACQAPLSVGFPRQEYWSELPFASPGHLPNPGIKPRSLALKADSLLSELPGKPDRWLAVVGHCGCSFTKSCLTLCVPMLKF